ncbi:MAG: polyprenyl diphosphate synthase [Candidatus Puniceispirillaceae bacterium]
MLPHHVAIIMDGNRRWAKQRRFDALRGHSQGSNTLKDIASYAHERGITYLTCFAFSTENWQRPQIEVNGLIELMKRFLMQDMETLITDNVRLRIIGDISAFDDDLQNLFREAEKKTSDNTGLNLTIAVNYGGQQDILHAYKRMAEDQANPSSEGDIKSYMQTSFLPRVDLLIRTGGEQRMSNFLLWDCAYAELYFSDKFWPDFSASDLDKALLSYEARDRRFGGDSLMMKTSMNS